MLFSVGSTVCWKRRLCNYKSHIGKLKCICNIEEQFSILCVDNSLKNLRFVLDDAINVEKFSTVIN